ncbi:MAG: hypothetical protein SH847_22960 [Roseiflexaceae bacterium]|nr:hypothetical protein [Roseiflexaceae bacterium]
MGKKPTSAKPAEPVPPSAATPTANAPEAIIKPSDPITITSHRALVKNQNEIFQRLNSNQELATLLLINPAMALGEAGVVASPRMRRHFLETLQYPPALRERREQLIKQLHTALGVKPRTRDAACVADIIFNKLKLMPLETTNHIPAYMPALDADVTEKLNALRPKARRADRYGLNRSPKGGSFSIAPGRATARRIDLNAALPALKQAQYAPQQLTLEELYFYKESHPLARSLLELAIIDRQAFPIQSAYAYRNIKRGMKRSAFRTWIRSVRFPQGEPHEPDR